MYKAKYLFPDVEKHTAGIIYVAMIALLGIISVVVTIYTTAG